MMFWLIGASFILVWIAEQVGVAEWFPFYGATGLLVSMILLALLSGAAQGDHARKVKKIKERLGA